ncbi:FtsK/SpoIIIE family DNA translocase [Adhaeribacter radiodurans]|uniref:DNA translocase FtsK n=1 Tax=Adhaeribacter radiodurans TaxID=2745197 RepID=A0A7L7L5C4_9BACT|nr:DNA translocase FtsK [Adhaeribacter radiodurans]QMU27973.1 DNA translocase FtsK [Adhaeribacter radiodurans]
MATNTYKREADNVPKAKNSPKANNEPVSRPLQAPKPVKTASPGRSFPKLKFFSLGFLRDRRFHLFIGFTLLLAALYLLIAFISYLFTGPADQSVVEALNTNNLKDSGLESENWLGLIGAWISNYFIYKWVGVASFFIIPIIFFSGYKILFRRTQVSLSYTYTICMFATVWCSLLLGYIVLRLNRVEDLSFLSGGIGYETALWFESLIGLGTAFLLAFLLIIFVVFFFNITSLSSKKVVEKSANNNLPTDNRSAVNACNAATYEQESTGINQYTNPTVEIKSEEIPEEVVEDLLEEEPELVLTQNSFTDKANVELTITKSPSFTVESSAVSNGNSMSPTKPLTGGIQLDIEPMPDYEDELFDDEDLFSDEDELGKNSDAPLNNTANILSPAPEFKITDLPVEPLGREMENYDPTLDLARYQYPNIELLNDYNSGKVQVSKEELEANKDKIVETLANYAIGIASIKATIGPTVTLYEIVPDAGVRISKIKNLEDDIALSLAALGIRIIAPIPGKGTIGIEVPNKKKEMVAIKSILSTEKFQKSEMDLPIAFGKTITNEVFITDLAKMPHLLMAGATGQGKSVGLNAILTSLIYKKHPSQLKFVLVDPKKVELSLFNKIERHFLAKLPDSDEPIITDTKKVINTLNSLCMEMDMRYDLLKDAGCRNLKEYNQKFIERRLNPKKGHRFMPFIVLVIDELADLMMTAGKEVETPIARLAQLARAIGIHLVVATQRPSVNVITGIIKANFPCRISFKVTSKIDSRTILDTGGAEQLVGQGDMLFSVGSDLIRLQCAFVDTPEVDRICDFIGDQQGYNDAYLLPEFFGDESGNDKADFDPATRDSLFEEAARIIVTHQQGSTSLLQRRLKLGYNRAGRLIDQLEAAGVVGPFEGSKARDVLIPDEYSLEQLLNTMEK